jgi:hypothetical protein
MPNDYVWCRCDKPWACSVQLNIRRECSGRHILRRGLCYAIGCELHDLQELCAASGSGLVVVSEVIIKRSLAVLLPSADQYIKSGFNFLSHVLN